LPSLPFAAFVTDGEVHINLKVQLLLRPLDSTACLGLQMPLRQVESTLPPHEHTHEASPFAPPKSMPAAAAAQIQVCAFAADL
jgi:hypothetical protein